MTTRREFIHRSTTTLAGIGAMSVLSTSAFGRKTSANEKVHLALIGCRNMGFGLLNHALAFPDVRCVALCDVDETILNEKAAEIESSFGQKPTLYHDFRRMLEQRDIDAVIIGTPDHWHCLMMVYCLQAGMDVYVEKPLGNSIAECDIMVRAAKRYQQQVVQVGQQQRSGTLFTTTMDWVKSGRIGNLRKINIWANFDYGIGREVVPDAPVPDGLDYELWQGPARERPYNANRHHGSWRHFWDYGSGMASDWGVHLLDIALWTNDDQSAPEHTLVYAGNTHKAVRARETFDSMSITFPKQDWVIHYDVTAGLQRGPWDMLYGMAFIGDDGTLVVDRNKLTVYPEYDNASKAYRTYDFKLEGGKESHPPHLRNFVDCIKSREAPICTPEMGHAAAVHMHIANIAGRVGVPHLHWDAAAGRFTNSEEANALITPEYRHPWTLPVV